MAAEESVNVPCDPELESILRNQIRLYRERNSHLESQADNLVAEKEKLLLETIQLHSQNAELSSQVVSLNTRLHGIENFNSYLQADRNRLLDRVNKLQEENKKLLMQIKECTTSSVSRK